MSIVNDEEVRKLPILGLSNQQIKYVCMNLLDEKRAMANHGQSLAQLRDLGGMSRREIALNVLDLPLSYLFKLSEEKIQAAINMVLFKGN